MNNYKPNDYEKTIDLIEIIRQLIAGVKWIAFFGVVLAVLAGAMKYGKDYMTTPASQTAAQERKIEDIKNSLTPSELAQVEYLYRAITDITKRNELYNDSILMSLDASDVKRVSMTFGADCFSEYGSKMLGEIYSDYLKSGEFAAFMVKALGDEYTESDILELIYNPDAEPKTDSEKISFTFNMYLAEDMEAQVVMDAVKNALEEKKSRVNPISAHDLICVNESVQTGLDLDLKQRQSDYAKFSYDFEYHTSAIRNSISAFQEQYLVYLLESDADVKDSLNEDSSEKGTEDMGALSKHSMPAFPVKMIVFGFIFGCILGAIFVVIKFAFSNTLSSEKRMVEQFGGILFGDGKSRNEDIAGRICLACEQSDIDEVAFVGSCVDEIKAEQLRQLLAEYDINVTVCGDIEKDVEALGKCLDVGHAILFEKVDISTYRNIEKIILRAQDYKIDLMGSVVI